MFVVAVDNFVDNLWISCEQVVNNSNSLTRFSVNKPVLHRLSTRNFPR